MLHALTTNVGWRWHRRHEPRWMLVVSLLAALVSCSAAAVGEPTTSLRSAAESPATAAGDLHRPGAKLFGIAMAGAEFGESRLPGRMGTDYLYPSDVGRYRYFAASGLTLVRIPFRWERVQPTPFGPLRPEDVAGLRATLSAAQAAGQQVILDLHNFGRYYERPLTVRDAPLLADVWERLAREFQGHPALYGYELMNEPHDLPGGAESWAYLAQVATNAIRAHDQTALVLVPGYQWQSAGHWPEHNAALNVRDPAGKLLYAAHQYFDADGTGIYLQSYEADGASPARSEERLRPFLDWLAERQARGIITEYGVPADDPRWLEVLDRFLAMVEAEPRLVGATYWSAGPWWGNYRLAVEPSDGQDRPQLAVLAKYPSRLLPGP